MGDGFAKDLKFSLLLDFYGALLTQKQKDVMELYYNEDLSLGEIAQNEGITRQGVRDLIKRGESVLSELEEKLHMSQAFLEFSRSMEKINRLCAEICDEYKPFEYSGKIKDHIMEIENLSGEYMNKYL